MQAFFPGSVLETGWDILFFWVAKMVFFAQVHFLRQGEVGCVFLRPLTERTRTAYGDTGLSLSLTSNGRS
jgi:hypothetical protein